MAEQLHESDRPAERGRGGLRMTELLDARHCPAAPGHPLYETRKRGLICNCRRCPGSYAKPWPNPDAPRCEACDDD